MVENIQGKKFTTAIVNSPSLGEPNIAGDKIISHVVAVPITFELLIAMMREGSAIKARCVEGLPFDAELVNTCTLGHTAYFVFQHDSFPPTRLDEAITRKTIRYERID